MENQTGFDLNAAIKSWRQETNGQPQLTAENCRELDAHLTDTVRDLQKRGLSDEESFWLARRRVGNTQRVAEEFAKADPARLWRERVFWMACAVLALSIWRRWTGALFFLSGTGGGWLVERLKDWLPGWLVSWMPRWMQEMQNIDFISFISLLISLVPLAMAVLLVKKNYWQRTETVIGFLFKSRARFVVAGAILSIIPALIPAVSRMTPSRFITPSFIVALIESFLWAGPLIALIAWLMPVRDGRKRTA